MPTRHIIPVGTGALTGTAELSTATEIAADASGAVFTSTASYERVSYETGASSAAVAGTADNPQRMVEETAASSAIATSDATATFVAYVGEDPVDDDPVVVIGSGTYDGEEREVWAINVETKATGRYTNFTFNSFARVNNRLFGFNDAGIYEITGSTDAGSAIGVFMQSATYREDDGLLLPRAAYLVGNLPDGVLDDLDFFVLTDKDERYDYRILPTDGRLDSNRVMLGKGLRTRHLRYGLFGSITEPLELSSVSVTEAVTARNI